MGKLTIRRYRCAICGRDVHVNGEIPAVYPFCGPRCRLVDLGKWLREEYSIDRDLAPEDLAEPPASPDETAS